MGTRRVELDLPDDILLALGRAAGTAGCLPSELALGLLRDALIRGPTNVHRPEALVADAVRLAKGWLDLQARLRRAGFVLRASAAAGLWLHTWPDDRALCPAADAGMALDALTLRFGAPFPGGSRRIAGPRPAATPRLRGRAA